MKDNNGKVILSLLAGATVGAIAGLLLAPETGEGTRASLKSSATKLGDDLNQLFKQGLTRFNDLKGGEQEQPASPDQASADDVLDSMAPAPAKPKKAGGKRKAAASTADASNPGSSLADDDLSGSFGGSNSDYDGDSDGRHTGNPSFGQTL